MGHHTCLFLVKADNKLFAKWRIKRLIKWVEKKAEGTIEWGRIISPITPINYDKVREYYHLQLDIELKNMKDIIPRINEVLEHKKISLTDLMQVKWCANYLCDHIPDFQHRIFYDAYAIWFPWDRKKLNMKKKKKQERFRIKNWFQDELYILFWDVLPTANYMAEVKFHH